MKWKLIRGHQCNPCLKRKFLYYQVSSLRLAWQAGLCPKLEFKRGGLRKILTFKLLFHKKTTKAHNEGATKANFRISLDFSI